jgi:hypothetical protein
MSNGAVQLHLHIGLEKTGTSSVQLFFARSQPQLLTVGILYPDTFRPRADFDNHAALAAAAQVDDSDRDLTSLAPRLAGESREAARDRLARQFEAEVAARRPAAIVLSSEHLSSRTRSAAEVGNVVAMLSRVRAGKLAVHVILRNQVDMASSWYATTVKSGETRHFDEIGPGELLPYLSFAAVTERWRAVCGRRALHAYSYDALRSQGVDTVEQLRRATGVPEAIPHARRRAVNASLSRRTAEIVRRINVLGRARFAVTNWGDVMETLSAQDAADRIKVPPALHAAIRQAFERENKEVERNYFDGQPALSQPLPPPAPPAEQRVRIDQGDMIALIRGLAERVGRPVHDLPASEEGLLQCIAELAEIGGRAVRLGQPPAA